MKETLRDGLLLLCLSAVIFGFRLGVPRLWGADEPRSAGCALQMLERGDWVAPYYNGRLRAHKHVLLFWGILAAYQVHGVNEFAARFPSALAGVGTVLLVYGIGRRLFSRDAACWSATVLATSLLFGMTARTASPDALTACCLAGTMAVFAFAVLPAVDSAGGLQLRTPRWWELAGMYSLLSLALLAKGPLGFVPIALALGALGITLPRWESQRRLHLTIDWQRAWQLLRPEIGLAAVLLVAGPWYVWVYTRTGGAWMNGYLEEKVQRAVTTSSSNSGWGNWGLLFFPVVLVGGFFPWSTALLTMLPDLRRDLSKGDRRALSWWLCLVWGGVYFIILTFSRSKEVAYLIPALPACALMLGASLENWRLQSDRVRLWSAVVMWGGLLAIGLAGLIAIPLFQGELLRGERFLVWLAVIPTFVGLVGWGLAFFNSPMRAWRLTALGGVCFSLIWFGIAVPRIDRHREVEPLAQLLRSPAPGTALLSLAPLEPSWVFYAGQPIRELQDASQAAHLWREMQGQQQEVKLIATANQLNEFRAQLEAETVLDVQWVRAFLTGPSLAVISPPRENSGTNSAASPAEEAQSAAEPDRAALRDADSPLLQ